jgi:hypothetical protein
LKPPDSKKIGGFALRFALVFALLACPWHGLKTAFAGILRVETEPILKLLLAPRLVAASVTNRPDHPLADLEIIVSNPSQVIPHAARVILLDSRSVAWMPHVMTMALCLATPLPFRGKVLLTTAGVVLASVLGILTVVASVWRATITETAPVWLHFVCDTLYTVLVTNLWSSFVGPLLIWLMLCASMEGIRHKWRLC